MAGEDDGFEVEDITAVARARNSSLEVTGALIATAEHFSQILEGPADAIGELMASINADPRHRDLRVLETVERETRWFPEWALAYAGRSSYVGAMIVPLLSGPTDDYDRGKLLKLIRTFAVQT